MTRRDEDVGGRFAVVVLVAVVALAVVVLAACRNGDDAPPAAAGPSAPTTTTTATTSTTVTEEPRPLRFGCPCEPGPELTFVASIDDRPTGAGACSSLESTRPPATRADVVQAATELRAAGAAIPDDVLQADYEIQFRDLVADAGTEADAVSVPEVPHRVLLAERHADEPPELLVPIVAHELLHQDTAVNRAEEITAVLHETVVAGSVLLASGDACAFETDLGRRFRTYLLLTLFNAGDIDDPRVLLPGRLGDRRGPLTSYFQAGDLPVRTTPRLADVLGSTCFEGAGARDGPDLIGSSIDGIDLQAFAECTFGDQRLAELAGLLALATAP